MGNPSLWPSGTSVPPDQAAFENVLHRVVVRSSDIGCIGAHEQANLEPGFRADIHRRPGSQTRWFAYWKPAWFVSAFMLALGRGWCVIDIRKVLEVPTQDVA